MHLSAFMDINHENNMAIAITEAEAAGEKDEVPVGAILVDGEGRIIARGQNRTITTHDPTAHAEIVALRAAAARLCNYRLLSTTLYVTVEPCVMCMGALIHARVERIVFGAPDPRWGAVGSLYDFSKDKRFNHHPEIISGVCREACRNLMVAFFKKKRTRPSVADTAD